jgi:pectinesterase
MMRLFTTRGLSLPSTWLLPLLLGGVWGCGGGDTGGSTSGETSASSSSSNGSSSSGAGGETSSSSSAGGAASSSSASSASSSGAGGATSSSSASSASSSGAGGGSVSSATRPQLTSAEASDHTILKYLAKSGTLGALMTDSWDPTAGIDLTGVVPSYTVASDNSGTQTTVQAAVTAATAAGGAARIYILVKAGSYHESVCVSSTAPPITLYSTDADASKVVIFDSHSNPEPKVAGTSANPCNANLAGLTYGTSGSAVFAAYAGGFQAKNITFQNTYDEVAYPGSNQAAVALMTQGDKLVFENVRVLGNQDTLYMKSPNTSTVARAYFKNSYIEGDVDFIFGRATAVIDSSTIKYLTARQGAKGGYVQAPSTAPTNLYGFLFINDDFTAEAGTPTGLIYLGRAWDEGVASGAYMDGVSPNGQTLIRNSTLGAHIRLADPWGTSTSGRAYDAAGNRLAEFQNSGPGAAP